MNKKIFVIALLFFLIIPFIVLGQSQSSDSSGFVDNVFSYDTGSSGTFYSFGIGPALFKTKNMVDGGMDLNGFTFSGNFAANKLGFDFNTQMDFDEDEEPNSLWSQFVLGYNLYLPITDFLEFHPMLGIHNTMYFDMSYSEDIIMEAGPTFRLSTLFRLGPKFGLSVSGSASWGMFELVNDTHSVEIASPLFSVNVGLSFMGPNQNKKVKYGNIGTPGMEIIAQDGSFTLSHGENFQVPFSVNTARSSINHPLQSPLNKVDEALSLGAKRVRIRLNGANKELHGVLLISNIFSTGEGAETHSLEISLPSAQRNAALEGRTAVVYGMYSMNTFGENVKGKGPKAWILWVSNTPF